jgi:hypothetical protein
MLFTYNKIHILCVMELPPPPKLTRQRRLSEAEGEQLLTKSLLECRAVALRQYAHHYIVNRMRVLRYMRFDTYCGVMDYLGEIQYLANRYTAFDISWTHVSPNVVFSLVGIIRRGISKTIQFECINPFNYNVTFHVDVDAMEPIFKDLHIFPHINALSIHALGWDVV